LLLAKSIAVVVMMGLPQRIFQQSIGPGIAANISTPTSVTTLYCGRYIVHNLIHSSQLWTKPYDS